MRVRAVLIMTAIVSSILGAGAVYLVLTVPNDLQAGALLRKARKDIEAGNNDRARQELSKIVQQYPRTDAAAAATVALATVADSERHAMLNTIDNLRKETANVRKELADLAAKVNTPPPAAAVAVGPAAPSASTAAPAPKPAPKKASTHHRRTKRRRRRH